MVCGTVGPGTVWGQRERGANLLCIAKCILAPIGSSGPRD